MEISQILKGNYTFDERLRLLEERETRLSMRLCHEREVYRDFIAKMKGVSKRKIVISEGQVRVLTR